MPLFSIFLRIIINTMQNNHKEFKKWLMTVTLAVVGILLCVLAVAANMRPQSGRSGVWNGIAAFLHLKTPTAIVSSPSVALYAPKNDYESAVIAAVKKASPAVVSIIISEQVPIVEQCPYNPFGDLPSEFQQFFGNTPDMTQPCDSGKTQLQEVGGGSGFSFPWTGSFLRTSTWCPIRTRHTPLL